MHPLSQVLWKTSNFMDPEDLWNTLFGTECNVLALIAYRLQSHTTMYLAILISEAAAVMRDCTGS